MNAGICTGGCGRWRVVIRLPRCQCTTGIRHRTGECPRPVFTDWFCREHECGARLPALHVTNVADIPRRPAPARTAS